MQTNNSPRFIRNFTIGLIASTAGALVALPGTAMPEPGESAEVIESVELTDSEATEAAPAEAIAEPTANETLPVAEADELLEEPIAENEGFLEEAAADTEEFVEEAAADTEEFVEEAAADTEEFTEEATAEADELVEEPMAETEEAVEATEEVVEEPVDATEEVAEDINTEEFTISELTNNSDSFTVLAAALEAADLSETLGSEGPFTVFAPTDEAFADLPEGAVEQLLLPENKDVLVQVLTYHVVPGAVLSTELETGSVPTVEGSDIAVEVADTVTVNNANVVFADVAASNGVIHVIDRVILPPAPEANSDIDSTEAVQ